MHGHELIYEDDTLRQQVVRNVHIVAWFDAPTMEQMDAYGRCARRVYARYRGQSALINLAVAGRPAFSNDVRKAATDYTVEGLHRAGVAHVVLVPGLVGVSTRAFLSTMLLVGRPLYPTKVFPDIESAAFWQVDNLLASSSEKWRPRDIVDACRDLSQR